MAEGFLGRWSQRKRALAQGLPVPEPEPKAEPLAESLAAPPAAPRPAGAAAQAVASPLPESTAPALTLADTQALTPQSDFKPFVAPDVSSEVKNAAMKKLFADPHFNVMDGMDTYIDDYSKPDPLPESMLRQMVSAQFLGLFDETPEAAPPPAQSVTPLPLEASALEPDHDHPDLRLQPNHAAGPEEPGSGAQ